MTESDVLKAAMQYLVCIGFHVERRNTGARVERRGERTRMVRFARPGQADLYGWHRRTGRHIEVEVKRPGQVPTRAQELWLAFCRENGAIALWCDSVDSLKLKLVGCGF